MDYRVVYGNSGTGLFSTIVAKARRGEQLETNEEGNELFEVNNSFLVTDFLSIVGRSKSDHHRLHNSTFSLESHFNYNHATFLMMRRIPALLLYKKVEM